MKIGIPLKPTDTDNKLEGTDRRFGPKCFAFHANEIKIRVNRWREDAQEEIVGTRGTTRSADFSKTTKSR